MRTDSVSMPLSTTQALKGDSVSPPDFITGSILLCRMSSGPHSAPAITRPWPSRYLVPEWMTKSAPNSTGFCSAGEQKQLSTASTAPPRWAMSARAAMSQTSVSGLVGDSAISRRVLGRIAARHSSTSVCETKLDSTPNLPISLCSRRMVEPNTLREQTTWSPDLSKPISSSRIADMPLLVPMQPLVPSSAARRRSIIITVGLLKRL